MKIVCGHQAILKHFWRNGVRLSGRAGLVGTVWQIPYWDTIERQAEEYNIRFECEAKLPEDLPFEAGRLTVIFGNLLDNALEGSRKTEDAWILIKVSYEKGVLFLNIRNICDSKQLKFSDGKYITTKQEPENHGYG